MKTIAFYLPQFHRTPENDKWWGEGFTEWTNMKKAQPLFEGHYQPRIPLNKNYYDLSDVENIRWQAKIAKENGIYGFCFYHYWFNGKLLLEKPIHLFRENEDIDMNYCLCWANENWTNGWVSDKNNILIEHDFNNKDDWKKHIDYFISFFKDERYIKIDNKPVLIIYYPNIVGKVLKEMMDFWKEEAKKEGFEGITYIFQHPFFYYDKTTDKTIFDYGIEFQPTFARLSRYNNDSRFQNVKIKISKFLQQKLNIYIHLKNKKLVKYDYDEMWQEILNTNPETYMFPGAFVDWDNTPRKGTRGSVIIGANPDKFKKYFSKLVKKAKSVYKKDYIFIFAWNEWAEGGYLEPDERYGYKYLNAIRDVLLEENEFPYNRTED